MEFQNKTKNWIFESRPISSIDHSTPFRSLGSDPKDLKELEKLKRSIEEFGLLEPILINHEGKLIAGIRRLEALRMLGETHIPVHIAHADLAVEEIDMFLAENQVRKELTHREIYNIYKLLEPAERLAAEERQKSGKPSINLKEGDGEVIKIIARKVGKSASTLRKIIEVFEAAESYPEKYGDIPDMVEKSGKIHMPHRILKNRMKLEEIKNNPSPYPEGKYNVIVVDPPWQYPNTKNEIPYGNIPNYPCMPIEDIMKLPIDTLAADDCLLFLWVTEHFMAEAFILLESWNIKNRRKIVVWFKEKSCPGQMLNVKAEFIVFGYRGKPVTRLESEYDNILFGEECDVASIEVKPTKGRRLHSKKPEDFYDMVDDLCTGTKLEMFSRREREGWTHWGNEAPDKNYDNKPKS